LSYGVTQCFADKDVNSYAKSCVFVCVCVCLCIVPVSSVFSAFIQLTISHCQSDVVMRLCQLHFQHPSVITWDPQVLRDTIRFLLSQSAGDFRSRFVVTAVHLAELATKLGVYPRLNDIKQSRGGVLCLWDFMNQAEIYTLLCVYLRSVQRQLGPSRISLDFNIVGSQRPIGMQPQLQVSSVDHNEFVYKVEHALMDNLLLSPADFRRTSAAEWWVMIEDLASIVEELPKEILAVGGISRRSGSSNRERHTTAESRGNSSVSSSSDSLQTPKRKVLLATPSDVMTRSCGKLMDSNTDSLVISLVPPTPTSGSVSRGAIPMSRTSSHIQHQLPADADDKYGLPVISPSTAASISLPLIDFSMPPPGHSSALLTSHASYAVPRSGYQGSASDPIRASHLGLASTAKPLDTVMPTGYSAVRGASGPVISWPAHSQANRHGSVPVGPTLSHSAVTTSYAVASPLPMTMPVTFPHNQHICTSYSQPPPLLSSMTWTSLPSATRMTAAGKFC